MSDLYCALIFSGILTILVLVFLVFAVVKTKMLFIYLALGSFLILIIVGAWAAYLFVNKSYDQISNALKPRSGIEIYTALFGEPASDCVKILHHQDQIIPKIDYAIWLHFKTCPPELRRVLKHHPFKASLLAEKSLPAFSKSPKGKWFQPNRLGDSILVFDHRKDEFGAGQTLYVSNDSTEVYLMDSSE